MIVKKSSERNVTPMRAAPSLSNFQTRGFKRRGSARRGRLSKLKGHECNKDSFRVMKAGGRRLNGGTLTSGCRRDHGESTSAAGASEDFSQDSSSITMPSGVSSFLLDCMDGDSPTSDEDLTLSSIEEFRKADNCDGGSALLAEDRLMNGMKNSTLLELSHAQDLVLQPHPNLSSILELPLDPAEDKEKSSPLPLSPLHVTTASDIASGGVLRSVEDRTPVNTRLVSPIVKKCFAEKGKLIKCRKVTFSDIVRVQNVSCHKRDKREQRDERVQPDASVSEESPDVPSGPVRFFDFADECERDAFFHRLKQTHSFMFPAKPIISTI